MFLLNSFNARLKIVLDIPLCKTNKIQKGMSVLGPKILNKFSSDIKKTATTVSFTPGLKKKILEELLY